jgi:hypothetical protein
MLDRGTNLGKQFVRLAAKLANLEEEKDPKKRGLFG